MFRLDHRQNLIPYHAVHKRHLKSEKRMRKGILGNVNKKKAGLMILIKQGTLQSRKHKQDKCTF